MIRARLLSVAITAAAIAAASPARAQPDDPKAKAQELAASAKAHFDRGEYAPAADAYREAYRLWPSPGLLYNLGQAYRLAGDCAHASASYREYLHLQPDSPYRATVEQNLSAADACAKPAAVSTTPVAVLAPAPAPVSVPSAAESDGDDGSAQRVTGLAVAGGGALLALAGTYFAIDASRAQREVADFYARGGDWSQIADVDARGQRDHTLAITGFAIGGAAIAAGATLYLLARDERAVAIVPARGGGEVVLSWRF
jgi:tetratricopeptide (TPR) repeat protein